MRIGLGVYTGECLPVEGISPTEVLQHDVAQAKVAEDAGLDSIWISEHHFLANGYNPSVVAMAAAMATATERIRIGPALVLAPLWHPIRLAEDSAMVDVLSGGRYTLGVGLGYRDVEYAGIGVDRHTRGRYLEELVQIVKMAWSDQNVTFHGQLFDFDDVPVYPKPVQAGGIPMWIGGHADVALQRAARYADGFAMDGGTDSDVFAADGHNRDLFWRVEQMVAATRKPSPARARTTRRASSRSPSAASCPRRAPTTRGPRCRTPTCTPAACTATGTGSRGRSTSAGTRIGCHPRSTPGAAPRSGSARRTIWPRSSGGCATSSGTTCT